MGLLHTIRSLGRVKFIYPFLLCGIVIFTGIGSLLLMVVMKNPSTPAHYALLEGISNSAYEIIDTYYNFELNGFLSRDEAQKQAVSKLHSLYAEHPEYCLCVHDTAGSLLIKCAPSKENQANTFSNRDDWSRVSRLTVFEPWQWSIKTRLIDSTCYVKISKVKKQVIFFSSIAFAACIILLLLNIYHGYKIERIRFDAEKNLYESERRFEAIFDSIADGIVLIDCDDNSLLMCNRSLLSITGYDQHELLKFTAADLHPPGIDDQIRASVKQQEDNKYQIIQNIPLKCKNGEILIVDLTTTHISLFNKKYGMGIFSDISYRREKEEKFRYRIEFDKLVCTMSTMLMDTSSEKIDAEINNALKAIGGFLCVERVFICLMNNESSRFENTHAWNSSGITDPSIVAYDDPLGKFPWFFKQIMNETVVHIPDVRTLPKEASSFKKMCLDEKRKSFICVPLSTTSHVFGFLEFDVFSEKRMWDDDIISLLRIVGEIVSNALARKRTALALKKSEERYRTLVNNINLGIVLLDTSGTILMVNDMICKLYQETKEEFIGKKCSEKFAHTNISCDDCPIYEVLDSKMPTSLESQFITDAGRCYDVRIKFYPLFNEKDEITGFIQVIEDITESKKAEEQIRLFKQFADASTQGFAMTDLDYNLTYINPALGKMTEYSPEEVIGNSIFEYYSKEFHSILTEKVIPDVHTKGCWLGELPILSKSGNQIQTLNSIFCIKDENDVSFCYANVITDITERKEVEKILRHERDFSTGLINSSPIIVCGLGADGIIRFVNPVAETVTGFSKKEMVGSDWIELFYPDELSSQIDDCRACYQNGELRNYPLTLKTKQGDLKTIEWSSISQYDEDGNLIEIIGFGNDVTERNRNEEEARKFISISDHASYGLCIISTNGIIEYINKYFAEIHGYSVDEVKGQSIYMFHSEEQLEQINEVRSIIFEKGAFQSIEIWHSHKNGTAFPMLTNAVLVRDEKNNPKFIEITCIDTTEHKRLEEELTKTRKLESIGILAGGIAHDFNNLLTAILGNISLAMLDLTEEHDKLIAPLKNAEKASLQARELSQQLLTFSRGGAPIKKTTSIEELIYDSANFSMKGSNVKCNFQFDNNLFSVDIDKGQISQVINNLVINAQQAMSKGGTIHIACQNKTIGRGDSVKIKPGNYIHISIADEGIGISQENLTKIFDPYFTTKTKGSGLGLATSYSIIKKHEGCIEVESEENVGTIFHIYLPASKKVSSAESDSSKDQQTVAFNGKGTILVMDDEEIIRDIVGELLIHLGYEVEFAQNGTEAIDLYCKSLEQKKPFDAVIMDLTIPGGMGGKEAMEELLKIDPKVKSIVSSGYSNDPVMAQYKEYGFSGIARKPFDIKEISTVLHGILSD